MKNTKRSFQTGIPSRAECLELMARHNMLENIVRHSLVVCRVGVYLSRKINRTKEEINIEEVEAAALLHDITKSQSLQTGEDHAVTGAILLEREGYPRIGEIVKQHIHLRKRKNPLRLSEEELVNYADKRVRHEEIVSVKERFIDLLERYGKLPGAAGRISYLEQEIYRVESKIFHRLDFEPEDLPHILAEEEESLDHS